MVLDCHFRKHSGTLKQYVDMKHVDQLSKESEIC